MARIPNMNYVATALLVALVVSGCQTSNNRWVSAWKERSKPKPQFKGLEPEPKEEVTYWPFKAEKNKPSVAATTSKFRDKLAKESEQKKLEARIVEAINDGDALRKSGQLEEARVVYTKALKLSPDNADLHHRLAIVADKQGDYLAADQHYQAALRVRPQDPNLLSDLGYSFSIRGKKEKAEQTLKKALEIEPAHKFAMANLGAIYAQQNRYPEALAMCRAGTHSETEAQQYMAYISKIDTQGGSAGQIGNGPGFGPGQTGTALASTTRDNPGDISKLDFEQVKALMARERDEAVRRRTQNDQQQVRNPYIDDGIDQQQRMAAANSSNAPGYPSGGPVVIGPQGQTTPAYVNNQSAHNQYGTDGVPGSGGAHGQAPMMNAPFNSGTQGTATNAPFVPQTPVNQAQLYADTARNSPNSNPFRAASQQLPPGRPGNAPIQQAVAQQIPAAGANNYQPPNDQVNASQLATRIGMSAGPGGMFPIVPGSANENTPPANPTTSFNNRFGGEFQQSPAYQNSQNWGGNQNDQAPAAPAMRTDQIEGVPPIYPASPSQNWQSPTTGGLNWPSSTSKSLDWSNENSAGSGAAGSGIDSGVSLLRADQDSGQRQDSVQRIVQPDKATSGMNSFNGPRSNHNSSRPYSGTWPATNSLSTGQRQTNSFGGSSSDGIEMYGNRPSNNGVSINPANQNAGSTGSVGTLPQYPFAPNR